MHNQVLDLLEQRMRWEGQGEPVCGDQIAEGQQVLQWSLMDQVWRAQVRLGETVFFS